MNKLTSTKRAQVIGCLVEGNSIRATVRITGVAKNTITKLLVDVGEACADFQDLALRSLPCKRIQCDETWAFCHAKQNNVPAEHRGEFGYGDVWTWTSLCADTKLVPSWLVSDRSAEAARVFIEDLSSRLANRVQLTTDGNKLYIEAVVANFDHGEVDYAMLQKIYGTNLEGQRRYSPVSCVGIKKEMVLGSPDSTDASTSYVERQNLTMRMHMRRFTRLTNAFPKKVENLAHAVSLHFMYYNFARVHPTLRVTPAMKAGIADHVWTLEEIASLIP